MIINMYTLIQLHIHIHVQRVCTVCVSVDYSVSLTDRSRECLKHFVVVLTERKLIRELCNYTYCGMEEEVQYNIIYGGVYIEPLVE